MTNGSVWRGYEGVDGMRKTTFVLLSLCIMLSGCQAGQKTGSAISLKRAAVEVVRTSRGADQQAIDARTQYSLAVAAFVKRELAAEKTEPTKEEMAAGIDFESPCFFDSMRMLWNPIFSRRADVIAVLGEPQKQDESSMLYWTDYGFWGYGYVLEMKNDRVMGISILPGE